MELTDLSIAKLLALREEARRPPNPAAGSVEEWLERAERLSAIELELERRAGPRLEAAFDYAARGWPVLPCEPRGKRPLVAGGYKAASKDPNQIREWWFRWPWANVGIATGEASGLAVLDIDPRAGGEESVRALQEELGPLPAEVVVHTGGGGWHIYFRIPAGAGRIPSRPLPGYRGLELKAEGTYVIAPPSRHPSGNDYYWALGGPDVDPPLIPEGLLALARAEGNGHRAEPVPEVIPDGQRNTALFRFACSLRDKGLSEPEILAHLRLLNQRCDPPLGEKELAGIAKSAMRYEAKRPLTQPPPAGAAEPEPGPLKEADAAELAQGGAPEAPESLPLLGLYGYIIKGWGHILAGHPKSGKTELAFACLREWAALGLSVVLFTEEGEYIWRHRLGRYPDFPSGRLRLVFALGEDPKRLLARAAEGTEEVVVVDSLRTLLQLPDENDNAVVVAALRPWETALQGKTRLYLHHLRKSGGDHGLGVAGASGLVAAVDRILELRYDADPNRRRLLVLSRLFTAPEQLLGWQEDGELKALGAPGAVALAEVKARILGLESLGEAWLKTDEVREALGDPKPSENQVREALNRLYAEGLVDRDPKEPRRGKTVRWRLAHGLLEEEVQPELARST